MRVKGLKTIDFTLPNARRFYSSIGDPYGSLSKIYFQPLHLW